MNSLYHAAIHQLFLSLSLPQPQQEESVTSLQIGELTCHLTEHPANYLLMFTRLDAATSAQAAAQNLFSQDPCKPVLGFDAESLTPVLWSRQPLQQLDRAQIHHQLEQLISAADELSRW
ncbi:CesT family type III secretion system chaperone [Aeromonas salmonicida]|uniref:CesT family type III secretion system chaperone n=1 Tax=Aeromonas salmonicida TaxID=645 RepID=UPI002240C561|nr:CesT family type III secretion system chaperone [Aeromonas salmonicida]MDF8329024.1 CesT family type III secretion system chaperone [Aeromonas salmonicida]